jgi:hypothetical protein
MEQVELQREEGSGLKDFFEKNAVNQMMFSL